MKNAATGLSFSLLNTDYVALNKSWNYKNILSPFYRLYLPVSGRGKLFNTVSAQVLEAGWMYLIPSFTVCNYYCARQLSLHYLHFIDDTAGNQHLFPLNRKILKVKATARDMQNVERIAELHPGRGLYVTTNPKEYEQQPVLQSFRELNKLVTAAANLETQGIILQLLSRFMVPGQFELGADAQLPSKIAQATDFIKNNLQTPITVTQLAQKAGQHSDYFSRQFHQHTGYRPLAYTQYKRIEKAQFLVVTTSRSFNEIAADTGFDTLAYFSRVFKNITGQSPSQYRSKNAL